MRLDRLVVEAGAPLGRLEARLVGDGAADVGALTLSSDEVTPGTLFACVPGSRADGHNFAPAALAAGASALVVERPLDLAAPQLVVTSARRALGPLADALWDHPSRHLRVVGVTGTNGKTTTVSLLAEVLNHHGWKTATIGTLTQARTTPEAPELQARLAQLRHQGYAAAAMEVSSHALDQHRVDATTFAAAVFTNLSQEHLDYHGTMERYFEAKAALFEPGRAAAAVVNGDDEWGRRLIDRLVGEERRPETFSIDDAADLRVGAAASQFRWRGEPVSLRLGGRFNVANALAAATCALVLGVPAAAIAAGLSAVEGVPGRFEPVDEGQPFTVVVDYAHTPDGLAQALGAARELTSGQLIVVFGAGGDRDHAKRPQMGEAVTRLAHLGVLTSDNPRGEDPQAIIDQVAAGGRGPGRLVVQPDRADAIATALGVARPGDVVVIAGKGHETGQEIGGRVLPFDDREQARSALRRIMGSRRGEEGLGP